MSGMKKSGSARLAVLFGLIVALGSGAALWHGGAIGQEAKKEVSQKPVHQAQQLSTAFRKAAEVAMPSVVTVRSKTKAHAVHRSSKGQNPLKGQNPFKG